MDFISFFPFPSCIFSHIGFSVHSQEKVEFSWEKVEITWEKWNFPWKSKEFPWEFFPFKKEMSSSYHQSMKSHQSLEVFKNSQHFWSFYQKILWESCKSTHTTQEKIKRKVNSNTGNFMNFLTFSFDSLVKRYSLEVILFE